MRGQDPDMLDARGSLMEAACEAIEALADAVPSDELRVVPQYTQHVHRQLSIYEAAAQDGLFLQLCQPSGANIAGGVQMQAEASSQQQQQQLIKELSSLPQGMSASQQLLDTSASLMLLERANEAAVGLRQMLCTLASLHVDLCSVQCEPSALQGRARAADAGTEVVPSSQEAGAREQARQVSCQVLLARDLLEALLQAVEYGTAARQIVEGVRPGTPCGLNRSLH